MHDELIVEEGVITRLTINRPERHNAINTEVGDAMVDVVTKVGRDPAVQVLILAARGAPSAPATMSRRAATAASPTTRGQTPTTRPTSRRSTWSGTPTSRCSRSCDESPRW